MYLPLKLQLLLYSRLLRSGNELSRSKVEFPRCPGRDATRTASVQAPLFLRFTLYQRALLAMVTRRAAVALTVFVCVLSGCAVRFRMYGAPHSASELGPQVLVASRAQRRLYPAPHSCDTRAMLEALKEGSREMSGDQTPFAMNRSTVGFKMPSTSRCSAELHVFSPAEACDLLGAFGSLYIRGDSFMRHFFHTLLMVIRGPNGAMMTWEDRSTWASPCELETVFFGEGYENPRHCYKHMLRDSTSRERATTDRRRS